MTTPGYESLALEPLTDAATPKWSWRQVKAERRTFSLRAGERLIAGLRFEKSSGAFATADTAGARFTFERRGVFRTRILVRAAASEDVLATFTPEWSGNGHLEFADGRRLRWQTRTAMSFTFEWRDADDRPLLAHEPLPGSRLEAEITPTPLGLDSPDLPLLVTLAHHLGVLAIDELIATTAALGSAGV